MSKENVVMKIMISAFFDDVVFVLGIGIKINNNIIDYIMVITIT